MEKPIRIEWRDVVVFADSPEEAVAIIEGLRRRSEAEALLPTDRPDMPAQRLLRALRAIQEAGQAGLRSGPLAGVLGVATRALGSTSRGWGSILRDLGYDLEDAVAVVAIPGGVNGWFPGPRLPEVIRRLEEQLGQGPPARPSKVEQTGGEGETGGGDVAGEAPAPPEEGKAEAPARPKGKGGRRGKGRPDGR